MPKRSAGMFPSLEHACAALRHGTRQLSLAGFANVLDALAARRRTRSGDTPPTGPFHFRIGVVPLSIRCACVETMRTFRALYAGFEADPPPPDAIQIDVRRTRAGRSFRRRYEVWADGTKRFTVWDHNALLPHIELALNWHIMLYLPRYYQVHAGVMEIGGEGVIFPAAPGSGKSTLTAGLLARGWRYLSDEFALIDPETLLLQPYPKALCIKKGSFDVLRGLGVSWRRRGEYVKGNKGRVTFVRPGEIHPQALGATGGLPARAACPIRHIIFCDYQPGRSPSMEPISRADAVLRLNRQSFNFLKFRARGIAILSDVARGAHCYQLASGAIDETCDLVARAVARE